MAKMVSGGIAIFFLLLGTRRGGWSTHPPAALLTELGRSGRVRKNSRPSASDLRTVKLATSRYTE